MNWKFQYPEYSWLFLAIPFFVLLFVMLVRWKKKMIKRIGDKRLVLELIRDYSPTRFLSKFVILSLAFGLGVLAVMNLRKPETSSQNSRKGIDLAIALDVSKSMLATDIAPNRLERARQFILKLMDKMPNDRIALVFFAGRAYLQMPLTVDHGAAKMYITSADPESVPQQGTVISEALNMGARAFNSAEKKYKAILLISDGEDHDESAVKTAKELARQGIMINTIGIGSTEGSMITERTTGEIKKDENGQPVISKLNEDVLKQIAENTNGVYTRLQDSDEATAILMKQLSQIDRKAYGDESMMDFKTAYALFATVMFVLLLAEVFIAEKKVAQPLISRILRTVFRIGGTKPKAIKPVS